MLSNYYTIKQDGDYEIVIKKSSFICHLRRINNEDEAKEHIQQIKKEHWKANHNCVSYVLGDNQEIQRSSDDGEPSGTAGVPMLEVLKVKELRNVLAVVTRYFGGTKLGAGGLIRAYSSSVSEAIEHVGLVEGKLQQEMIITVDYSSHGKLEHFLSNHPEYTLCNTQFSDTVTLYIMVDEKNVQLFEEKLTNLLNAQYSSQKGRLDYFEMPINKS